MIRLLEQFLAGHTGALVDSENDLDLVNTGRVWHPEQIMSHVALSAFTRARYRPPFSRLRHAILWDPPAVGQTHPLDARRPGRWRLPVCQ
jgi:hypothetical protein